MTCQSRPRISSKEVSIIQHSSSRLSGIDGIRGFSLLGILLANTLAFQYGIWESNIIPFLGLSGLDSFFYAVVNIVVKGSFAPIFAFLYGFGTIKMTESLEQKGLSPYPFLIRRFVLLLVFGLLHFFLLWEGDILGTYGLAGFLLLAFLRVKPKALIITGICILILFSLMMYGSNGGTAMPGDNWEDYAATSTAVYQGGSYGEIQAFRLELGPSPLSQFLFGISWLFTPVLISSMFLFGMAAARMKLLHRPSEERSRYIRYAAILIPVGLALKAFGFLQPELGIGGSILTFGGTVLALGYISAFALMFSVKEGNPTGWREKMISVGRLSLSNYLLQTAFGVLVFFGYGLGLFGKLGVALGCLLALCFFVLQAWGSSLYLRKFRIGPAEKLLRGFTWLGQRRKPPKSQAPGM